MPLDGIQLCAMRRGGRRARRACPIVACELRYGALKNYGIRIDAITIRAGEKPGQVDGNLALQRN